MMCPICQTELVDPATVPGPPFPAPGDYAICTCLAILRYRAGAAAGELLAELVELDEIPAADRMRIERARDRIAWTPPRRPRGTGAGE
jgi:hypothetical protein